VQHYKQKYGLPLPIWVSIELWDFGLLSNYYQGLNFSDKSSIAEKYQLPIQGWKIMASWLRSINYIRNVVAHHSRLWNKNIIDRPRLPRQGEVPAFDHIISNIKARSRIYVIFCILLHFMRQISSNSSWPIRLKAFVLTFPTVPGLSFSDMGFPKDWQQQAIWQ